MKKILLLVIVTITLFSCKVNHYHYHSNQVFENENDFKKYIQAQDTIKTEKPLWFHQL